jgi:predicted aldo/keto reductase-like oxidoreductase
MMRGGTSFSRTTNQEASDDGTAQVREWYSEFPVQASACVECGVCLERCPFDVDIMAKLQEAVELFETAA